MQFHHNNRQIETRCDVDNTVSLMFADKHQWRTWYRIKFSITFYCHGAGTVNQPGDVDEFWTVEFSLSFEQLKQESQRTSAEPENNEVWFLQFGRSEQTLENVNGEYRIKPNSTTARWSWQPCDTINLLLQDRWGLVQFRRTNTQEPFNFPLWHVYNALFDMFDGLKRYKASHGNYVDTIEELDIPPYLLSRICVEVPEIKLVKRNSTVGFDVTVRSTTLAHNPAHIREDRYVYFQ